QHLLVGRDQDVGRCARVSGRVLVATRGGGQEAARERGIGLQERVARGDQRGVFRRDAVARELERLQRLARQPRLDDLPGRKREGEVGRSAVDGVVGGGV